MTTTYIPSYCLTHDKSRLTSISKKSIEVGLKTKASHYIISTAYDSWEKEAELKIDLLESGGVDKKDITIIKGVRNSFDEAVELKKIIASKDIHSLYVVAEKWHLPRCKILLQRQLPDIKIIGYPFKADSFECAYEPGTFGIKTLRSGFKPLWILWNIFFQIFN
jgi:uncharacterized SAM-binding protein YcdF (DUF218 family)